jgi:uncharacterized protein YegL
MLSGGIQVIPFYIVCDASTSMRGGRIGSVNAGLPEIHKVIASDPVISEKVRLGIISFSSSARVDLPLSQLSEVRQMPVLVAKGRTNFEDAIHLARQTIQADVTRLKSEGFSVLRPVVYFITDGRPTGGWKRLRDEWVDRVSNPYAPNIISFGVDLADKENLSRMSTQYTFVSRVGVDPGVALREIIRSIAASVVASGLHQEGGLVMPAAGENFEVIDAQAKPNQR